MRFGKSLATLALAGASLFGCSKEAETHIIPDGTLLTRDRSSGNPAFEMLKVDLESGSYGIMNGHLHWYAGDSVWKDVDADLRLNSWKRLLKQELVRKIEAKEIYGEGVTYKNDGTVQGD